ncbi:4Fe-4S dicluster domain-containing protein [candidate division KSB1 bacterium]|nr:4Fe-4S dicluster domain-containing protein [candidate division KSB1 bacterium]
MSASLVTITAFGFLVLVVSWNAWFALVSYNEGELRASLIAIAFALFFFGLSVTILWMDSAVFGSSLLVSLLLIMGGLLISSKMGTQSESAPLSQRFDERLTPFSLYFTDATLPAFKEWLAKHPRQRAVLERWQKLPGLFSENAVYYDSSRFRSANAAFELTASLRKYTDGEISFKQNHDPVKNTEYLKNWILSLDALSVGVTELKPYHLYSHVGRGKEYGQPVTLKHTYALVFTVEMRKKRMDAAPYAPTIVESANRYLQSATIAIQVADWIRKQGFPARAHIDGDYRVICPLVGRDAGLGELGRTGLLMTPIVGPRVRLAVVTTDMPLIPERQYRDPSMIEFCKICKKCAENCPSKAIPFDDMQVIGGVKRWQIDSNACFSYWCSAGTDCGICMRVCPFSHPDHFTHSFIKSALRHSLFLHKPALLMDNLFYGKRPKAKKLVD